MELVSVVLPAYNAASFIAEALDSVIAQTYGNLEIIVVDDGSTDDTRRVVSQYDEVKYVRQQRGGAGAARNRGIRHSHGKYVAFIDADDLWLPEKIERQVDLLRRSGLKWCYCDAYFSWYESEQVIGTLSNTQSVHQGDILVPYVLGRFSIPLPSTLVQRDVFEVVGYFDESLSTVEHTDLWARISVEYPIGYVDRPLVQIRKRFDSLKRTTDPEVTGENRRNMLDKIIRIAPERLEPLRKQLLATSYVREGKHFLRYGRISRARRSFREAIKLRPISLRVYLFWMACWIKPVPRLFYTVRWALLRDRKPNIHPGWWVE